MKTTMQPNLMLSRLYEVLFSDLTSLKWSEGWMALLFGVTMFAYPLIHLHSDEAVISAVMPLSGWGCVFVVYGILKLYLLFNTNEWRVCRICCTFFGLCLWSYVFVMASFIGTFSVTDSLFLMPILAEAWFLADKIETR